MVLLCGGTCFIPAAPKGSLSFVYPSICFCYRQHSFLLLGCLHENLLKYLRQIVLAFMPICWTYLMPSKKCDFTVCFRKTYFLAKADFREVCKTQTTEDSRRTFCVTTTPDWDHDRGNCICQWGVTVPKILSFGCLLSIVFSLSLGWSSWWAQDAENNEDVVDLLCRHWKFCWQPFVFLTWILVPSIRILYWELLSVYHWFSLLSLCGFVNH